MTEVMVMPAGNVLKEVERSVEGRFDLGFGILTFKPREFEFEGRRGSRIQNGNGEKEVGAASGRFHIRMDKFISILGEIYHASFINREVKRDEKKSSNESDGDTTGNEIAREADETARTEETSQNEKIQRLRRRIRGEVLKNGDTTLSVLCTISPRMQGFPGVRFTVVQSRIDRNGNREVTGRTTGVITSFRLMALLDFIGERLRRGSFNYPLGAAASLRVSSEKVTFESGILQTVLEDWQEKELKYLLAGKFFTPDKIKVSFRAGKMRLEENEDGIVIIFGGTRSIIRTGDLFLLWSILK